MARDAFLFLVPLLVATVTALWLGWTSITVVLAILVLFVAFFFRDPERPISPDPSVIVSPADGRIVRIEKDGAGNRISIFLSIFNVHVNRSPVAGEVVEVRYKRGRFRAAFNPLASVENEKNTLTIKGDDVTVVCSQIAGLIARRIVCWKSPGNRVRKGDRIGLIRFGSRVDLTVPERVTIAVRIGDRVKGGSSTIGTIKTLP
jgi:phosphatidylserine decarboxylase